MSNRWKEAVLVTAIPLDLVNADERLQVRAEGTDPELVEEYAERPDELEPIEVWHEPAKNTYWVSDGHHTVAALRKVGRTSVPARVRDGTFEDALKAALKANSKHGRRRSRKTIRRVVEKAHELYPGLSVREMAEVCDVAHGTVQSYRSETAAEDLRRRQRQAGPGRATGINTAAEPVSMMDTERQPSGEKDLQHRRPNEGETDDAEEISEQKPPAPPYAAYNAGIDNIIEHLQAAAAAMRKTFEAEGGEIKNCYASRSFNYLATVGDVNRIVRDMRDGKVEGENGGILITARDVRIAASKTARRSA